MNTIIENETQEASAVAVVPTSQNAVAVTESSPASIMGIIGRLSENPNVDIDKIERLMALYTKECERDEEKKAKALAAEAERLFYIDFIKMKPELPLIIRTKENTHTKSKYAPLEDINVEIDPILERFNFATSSRVIAQTDISVTMEVSVIHAQGHKLSMVLTMPIDDKGPNGSKNKTTGQGIAATMTSTKRIGFCALLNISTGDDDDGNSSNSGAAVTVPGGDEEIGEEKAAELLEILKANGGNETKFKKYMGVEEIKLITRKDLNKAMTALNDLKQEFAKRKNQGDKK